MGPEKNNNSCTFRREEHLRKNSEFRAVYEQRKSASNHWIILYSRANGLGHNRLGLSVSRKVGIACHRNRLRRLYREAFRLTKSKVPQGLDLVVIPRRPDIPSLDLLKKTFEKLISEVARKALLPPSSSVKSEDEPAGRE